MTIPNTRSKINTHDLRSEKKLNFHSQTFWNRANGAAESSVVRGVVKVFTSFTFDVPLRRGLEGVSESALGRVEQLKTPADRRVKQVYRVTHHRSRL